LLPLLLLLSRALLVLLLQLLLSCALYPLPPVQPLS
jgi:hypothetical protein